MREYAEERDKGICSLKEKPVGFGEKKSSCKKNIIYR